jgi:MscS family membrane protein
VNIETLSVRDKFRFYHVLSLRYGTSSSQIRQVVEGVHAFLVRQPSVDSTEPVRVRFIRLGVSSIDIEVVVYLVRPGWEEFLETQQQLLLEMLAIVERAGASLALPSQVLHLADRGTPAEGLPWLTANPADRHASAPR